MMCFFAKKKKNKTRISTASLKDTKTIILFDSMQLVIYWATFIGICCDILSFKSWYKREMRRDVIVRWRIKTC